MRISSSGQVTIPAELRERCGLQPGTEVEFELVEGGLLLHTTGDTCEPGPEAVSGGGKTKGELLVERLTGKGDWWGTSDEVFLDLRGPAAEV